MSTGIVQYKASDGTEVKLSPGIVANYIVTGAGGKDVSPREAYKFMAMCQARHLNPIAGDAYMTAYRNKRTGEVETSVIVSKDYYMRTATQQPGYDGMKAGIVVVGRDGEMKYREGAIYGKQTEKLVGGWAEVYDRNRHVPSRAEVSLEEYDQHRSLWLSKPATMIRKVALVQALREAYPGAFGGVYDSSEMPEEKVMVPPAIEDAPEPEPQPVETEEAEPEPEEQPAEPEVYDEDVSF